MLGNVRLHEQGGPFRVDAAGDENPNEATHILAQFIGRVGHRDGVLVDDAEEAVVAILFLDPVADGAEVVAQVWHAGGLDAGQYAGSRHLASSPCISTRTAAATSC